MRWARLLYRIIGVCLILFGGYWVLIAIQRGYPVGGLDILLIVFGGLIVYRSRLETRAE